MAIITKYPHGSTPEQLQAFYGTMVPDEVHLYYDGLCVELFKLSETFGAWRGRVTTEHAGKYTLVVDFKTCSNKQRLIRHLRHCIGNPQHDLLM